MVLKRLSLYLNSRMQRSAKLIQQLYPSPLVAARMPRWVIFGVGIVASTFSLSSCSYLFGQYTAVVQRIADDDFERGLIAAAEAACPGEAEIAARCREGGDPSEECDWSCDEVEHFKVVFAVTGEALAYYEGLIEQFESQRFTFAARPQYAELVYLADVYFDDRYLALDGELFTNVYVVVLQLDFHTVCGALCGNGMTAERKVVFNADGNLLKIEGDRWHGTSVS